MPFFTDFPTLEAEKTARAREAFRLIRQGARLLWWLRDQGLPEDDYRAWNEGGTRIEHWLKERHDK